VAAKRRNGEYIAKFQKRGESMTMDTFLPRERKPRFRAYDQQINTKTSKDTNTANDSKDLQTKYREALESFEDRLAHTTALLNFLTNEIEQGSELNQALERLRSAVANLVDHAPVLQALCNFLQVWGMNKFVTLTKGQQTSSAMEAAIMEVIESPVVQSMLIRLESADRGAATSEETV
jgi:predicted component of type VI protein secretion system